MAGVVSERWFVADCCAAHSACSRALRSRPRAGALMTYTTRPIGSAPYSTKVTSAPNNVPLLLVASATAIIRATYSQARGTMYMV